MKFALRQKPLVWLPVLLSAVAFLLWTGSERARRVEQVTQTNSEEATVDPASPTGYADGKRWLIVPERNSRSYEWILQTERMIEHGEWRVRHVDYDNAPDGRAVHSASLYRWWLGAVARSIQLFTGEPTGLAIERAAVWSEPLLHLLLLLGTTLCAVRWFGGGPAALLALGLVTFFPFAASFLPGVPDDQSLSCIFALGSVLPLLASLRCANPRRLFVLAGIAGGLGLWVSARHQAPILLGIAIGGLLAAWIRPRGERAAAPVLPWRAWAWAGGLTSIAAYLVEYAPNHFSFQPAVNHPLHALAWVGLGEALMLLSAAAVQGKSAWNLRRGAALGAAVAAMAALPIALRMRDVPFPWAGDLFASRLTFLPNGVVASSLGEWLRRDGLNGALVATGLPLLLLAGLGLGLLVRRSTAPATRTALALALAPVAVALPFAFDQLAWWKLTHALLLTLAVPVALALPALLSTRLHRGLAFGLVALLTLPGIWQLRPLPSRGEDFALTHLDVVALVERSLAHWIADRAEPDRAVVLVPPDRTINLCFHGGLRGLGSSAWENRDGLTATAQIVTAVVGDEAKARLDAHEVTHIVLPSWAPDLDQFARWMLQDPEDGFIMALHKWAMPDWLRPLPYRLPSGVGFDNQSVVIFEVTDESNRPAAAARLAEYFLEMQQRDHAAALLPALQKYPTDLGALVALAQVQRATGDSTGFTATLGTVLASLDAGTDRVLAWDRRVSLAVVLALGEHHDRAREQVGRCLRQLKPDRIRSLPTGALYRLMTLARAYDLTFSEPAERALALQLLPTELRSRL